jgi:hypothetical protein
MPVESFEYRSEAERLAMRQAVAFVAQMHDLALAAPPGQVLELCEQQAVDGGRRLLQETLRQAVQARVDQAEAKKGRPASARAGAGGG